MDYQPEFFEKTRRLFETTYHNMKLYDERDWARLEMAAQLATGYSVADFGTGPGVLVHSLAETGRFHRITALDIVTHSKALLHSSVAYRHADIRKPLPGDIQRHDTVFCMEVIEHVEERYNATMLKTLRELSNTRLVVTVPFNEPEPLWWHDKPGGHRQRFTLEKVGKLFPHAIATIQPRWGVDWLFVLEDVRMTLPHFQIVTKAAFTDVADSLTGHQLRRVPSGR